MTAGLSVWPQGQKILGSNSSIWEFLPEFLVSCIITHMPYSLGSVIGIGFLTFLDMAEGSVIKLRTLNIPH